MRLALRGRSGRFAPVSEDRAKPPRKKPPVYPWLRRDYFKTSVSWLVSLVAHAIIIFLLLATVLLDGGGGPGTGAGGKGELISTLVGKGELNAQTERTDDSKSLEEAIECSSRIAVMREGRIAQYAEPEEIFERPANVYVARLVGMENILDGRATTGTDVGTEVDLGFTRIVVPRVRLEGSVKVGLHGEHITLGGEREGLAGTVLEVRYLGEATRCRIRVGHETLVANIPPRAVVRAGDQVALTIDPSSFVVLSP